jgi:hypothetical protein
MLSDYFQLTKGVVMKSTAALIVATACGALFLVAMPRSTFGGAAATLGRAVPATEQVSIDAISHAPWNDLLGRYVDDSGSVNYRDWKASAADVKRLDQYLGTLSSANPTRGASRSAKLAFWINAYNAVTIKGILREYPTSSIRNHTAKVFGYNIWEDLLLNVGGRTYSLSQIEHDVLRKTGDPRIHFGIVCASRSCPRLRNTAYTAANLDQQLDDNARHFFAQPANFQVDVRARSIRVSKILDWFGEDFGATAAAQMKRIAPYLSDPSAREFAASGAASVSFLDYDWSLNEQATGRTARGR